MRLYCYYCGKSVSNDVPFETTVRGTIQCPECVETEMKMKMCDDDAMSLYDDLANVRGANNCTEVINEALEEGGSVTLTIESENGLSGEVVLDESHDSFGRLSELISFIVYDSKRGIKNKFEIDID